MKIKMLNLASGPSGNYEAGQSYEVPASFGQALIDAKAAVEIDAPKGEQKLERELIERLDIPEQAVQASQLTAEKALGAGAKRRKKP